MALDIDKLKARLAKAEAAANKLARQRQAIGSKLSKAERNQDTRRKVLAGSWVLDEIEKDAQLAERMRRDLNRFWLIRDDDRRLFGFDVLTEEQKAAHPNADSIRKGGRKKAEGSSSPGAAPASGQSKPEESEGK